MTYPTLECWWALETCNPCANRQQDDTGRYYCIKGHDIRKGSVGCMDAVQKVVDNTLTGQ
jgi:hypothetical protein